MRLHKNSWNHLQGDADEEGAWAATSHLDAHRLRVFRPRPHGPEYGEQADGDGEQKHFLKIILFFNCIIFSGSFEKV